MKLSFTKYTKIFLTITLLLVCISLIAIAYWGLKFGIDFTGGTIIEYKISQKPSLEELRESLTKANLKVGKIVPSNENYTIYFEPLSDELRDTVQTTIKNRYADSTRISIETISSSVGVEQTKNAILSIALVSLGIIVFLAISFRKVTKPFKGFEFGIAAVIALLHDALIVIGTFAFLGHYFNAEIDTLFITAILTVIGFSVHDTIVVFDRIRENSQTHGSLDYKSVIDRSLIETVARSINLTVTTLLVLFSLFILGPESLRWFVAALLIGMFSGTYSSIFVASQLLILFQDLKIFVNKRFRKKN